MKIYGLVGKKLAHSFSPEYFQEKFRQLKIECEYHLFEIESITNFRKIIENNPLLNGLNVTVPFKQSVITYLSELNDIASRTGSVNTIKFIRQNKQLTLKGFNTDVIGFEKTLIHLIKGRTQLKSLVLGTGGSAQSVVFVLRKLQIPYIMVSRKPYSANQISYEDLNRELIAEHQLIINTTPLGMFPAYGEFPSLPYNQIGNSHILYDLIYNPAETMFLKLGKKQNALVCNGLKMLKIQAEESWKIWNSD